MSERSTAMRLLVPLGVLGVFAAAIGAAVSTGVSRRDATIESVAGDIVGLERDRAEANSALERARRAAERVRAKHAIAVRAKAESAPAPGAEVPEYAAASVHGVVQTADEKLNVYII